MHTAPGPDVFTPWNPSHVGTFEKMCRVSALVLSCHHHHQKTCFSIQSNAVTCMFSSFFLHAWLYMYMPKIHIKYIKHWKSYASFQLSWQFFSKVTTIVIIIRKHAFRSNPMLLHVCFRLFSSYSSPCMLYVCIWLYMYMYVYLLLHITLLECPKHI